MQFRSTFVLFYLIPPRHYFRCDDLLSALSAVGSAQVDHNKTYSQTPGQKKLLLELIERITVLMFCVFLLKISLLFDVG